MHQAATPPTQRRKRKSRRRRYIFFGIAGVILLLIIASISGKREKPIEVTTEKAARRTIIQTVTATGKVQPETQVQLSPEVPGEITERGAIDGRESKTGDLR